MSCGCLFFSWRTASSFVSSVLHGMLSDKLRSTTCSWLSWYKVGVSNCDLAPRRKLLVDWTVRHHGNVTLTVDSQLSAWKHISWRENTAWMLTDTWVWEHCWNCRNELPEGQNIVNYKFFSLQKSRATEPAVLEWTCPHVQKNCRTVALFLFALMLDNMMKCPLGCTLYGKNVVKCPLGCPSSGEACRSALWGSPPGNKTW